MSSSIQQQLRALAQFRDDFLAGLYPQRTALGPGAISKAFIKSKSISASMLDVSNLEAVSTQTGSLNVDGAMSIAAGMTIGTGGSIKQGKTSYADVGNIGIWIGDDGGTPKVKIGNAAMTAGLTWDGTSLTIAGGGTFTGALSAATGTFTGTLTAGSGSTTASMGGANGLYLGSATPGSAPFQVTTAGVLRASSGTIGGLTLAAGSISNTTGATFSITSAGVLTADSVDINGGTIGALTVDGLLSVNAELRFTGTSGKLRSSSTKTYGDANAGFIIEYNAANTPRMDFTAGSGSTLRYLRWSGTELEMRGKLHWGSTGANYVDSSIMHFEYTSLSDSAIEWRNGASATGAYLYTYGAAGVDNIFYLYSTGTVNRRAMLSLWASNTDVAEGSAVLSYRNTSSQISYFAVADGSAIIRVNDNDIATSDGTNRRLKLNGRLYPGYDNAAYQTTGYIDWDNTNSLVRVVGATGFFPSGYIVISSGQYGSDGSGALPNPTKWVAVKDANLNDLYLPAYSARNPWAA